MSFLLFFPFIFLTTIFVPLEAMTGWLATIATYNPVTYLLEGLRSLVSDGWVWSELLKGAGAIALVGVVSMTLALMALMGRARVANGRRRPRAHRAVDAQGARCYHGGHGCPS